MALNIDKIIDLTAYANNPAPKVVDQLAIIHESKNGDITQYYIDPDAFSEGDKGSTALGIRVIRKNMPAYYKYIDYDTIEWGMPGARVTRKRIDRLGVKAFPNIGAIAHYKLFGQNISRILAPVNYKTAKTNPPGLDAVINTDDTITFTITPPASTGSDGITYMCYRITMQLGFNRLEYVTYDTVITVPKVHTTGEYICWATGYVNEGEITSVDSNELILELDGDSDSWPSVMPGSEMPQRLSELLDVNIGDTVHHQLLRFNSDIAKWENYISASQDAPESAAHILSIKYVNSQTVHITVDNRLKSMIASDSITITMLDSTPVVISSVQVSDFYNAVISTTDRITGSFNAVVKKEAFLNPSTDTDPYLCTVQQHSIVEYAGQAISSMNLVSFTSDDGNTAFTVPADFTWRFNNARLSSIYISGNSYLGFNSNSEHVKLNRRDTYIAQYRWQLYEAPIKMLRIRWEGWSPYGNRDNAHRYAWELFLFEDGNACLYLDSVGSSTTFNGTFTFNSLAYTISMSSQFATFKRISESASGSSASDWTYEAAPYTFIAG